MRNIVFQGSPDVSKYNIITFTSTTPILISQYNSTLSAVQVASPSKNTLLTYIPFNNLNLFSYFLDNEGYIVLAKNSFTISTDLDLPIPDYIFVNGETPVAKYTVFQYPYDTPTPISLFNVYLSAVQTTSPSQNVLQTYLPDKTLNLFTYFVKNFNIKGYVFNNCYITNDEDRYIFLIDLIKSIHVLKAGHIYTILYA
jgi:hypothetical protein